ncbi:MAG: helix-turn-helix transcriptional regulator [Bacteroidetes bacterium]|nr:helix-turn-helix transcriptional regulator [Bacteroidota bacterium]
MSKPAVIEELIGNVLYSCSYEKKLASEQYVAEHSMGYIITGSVQFTTAAGASLHGPGSMGLARRNMLLKTVKIPPPSGQFRSINIVFSQDILREYYTRTASQPIEPYTGPGLHSLDGDPFIKGFFESLLPYFEHKKPLNGDLLALKTNEAIVLLLQHDPSLKSLLFDFSQPHKIDLAAYMERHYTFNVPLSRFATLTGRSLAAFKRDFEKTFQTTPGRWLMQKRLTEARRLIKEEGKKPSDIYLDVGFENLSHFSFAFKKAFGKSPALL